nr:MAG TPA: tail completion protein [Bacteriophage sp.]
MTTQDIIEGMAAAIVNNLHNGGAYEDEVKQGLSDGDILINLVNVAVDQLLTHLYRGTFSFDVVYFDPSKENAYAMGYDLMGILRLIDTDDGKIRGQNMSYRYVDDALHLLVTYAVRLKEPVEKGPLMKHLTTNAGVKTNG